MRKIKLKLNVGQPKVDNLGLSNIVRRINGETPPFWKHVRKASYMVAAVGAGILTLSLTGGLALPAVLVTVGQAMAAIGGTGVTLAKLATDEPLTQED